MGLANGDATRRICGDARDRWTSLVEAVSYRLVCILVHIEHLREMGCCTAPRTTAMTVRAVGALRA